MENSVSKKQNQIKIFQFNEEQSAKVGAALQALADEIVPPDKDSIDHKCNNEVIELYDSDEERANNKSNEYENIYAVHRGRMEPQLLDVCNNYPTLHKSSELGSGTYITLTDITADQIEVREISTGHLLSDALNKGSYSPNTWTYESMYLEGNESQHIECAVPVGEFTEEPELGVQMNAQRVQICPQAQEEEEEITGDNSKLTEYTTCIDSVSTNMTDCLSEDSDLECYDSRPDDIINLIDSEIEEDQDDDGLAKSQNTDQSNCSNNHTNRTWADCYLSYSCPQCGIYCGNLSSWKLHTDTEHNFGTLEALNMKTIIDKTGRICFQCRDCSQKFAINTFYKIQNHRINHMPNKSYMHCRLCNKSFTDKAAVRRHLRISHRDERLEDFQKQEQSDVVKYIRISCPICNKQFADRKQWHAHLQNIHDYTNRNMADVTLISFDVYVCRKCDLKIRKRSIMDHMLTHEKYKSFACTYCNNYEGARLNIVMSHVQRVHLKMSKRLIKCQFCEATFNTDSPHRTHMRRCHKAQRKGCAVCNKQFYNASLLLSHMNFENHHQLK